jgi:hypothetical protein
MRLVLTLLIVLPLSLVACREEVSVPAKAQVAASTDGAPVTADSAGTETNEGTAYGEPIGDAPLVTLAELVANTEEYEGEQVRVEGLVTDVCAKRGCWMNIGAEEGPDYVQFKVTDGVMVFPMDAKGGHAEAEGTVQRLELDLEATRNFLAHKAEEAGEEFDATTVVEPMVIVRLAGTGAVIRSQE